jgi:hypothetical protein
MIEAARYAAFVSTSRAEDGIEHLEADSPPRPDDTAVGAPVSVAYTPPTRRLHGLGRAHPRRRRFQYVRGV